MRALFGILALLGLGGVVFGALTIIQGSQRAPFSYENHGGPGSIISGLLMLSVSLYLLSAWPRLEAGDRDVHHR